MRTWQGLLHNDPLPWLLEDVTPAVRHLTLLRLLDLPEDAPAVQEARSAAMQASPIAAILTAQHPQGYWVKGGPGYTPKYRGTVWQLLFLDQMGADGRDPRVRAACDYVLTHTQTTSGGFAAWGGGTRENAPGPSLVIHCLNGNLLRALIGFGWLEDERVQRAIDWQARAITGENFAGYYRSGTSGPGFRCVSNGHLPCAWGAIKGLLALARIPSSRRAPHVVRAIEQGVAFLLASDPAGALYPAGTGNPVPSPLWFTLGFPIGYTADILQNLEVLCALGYATDKRVEAALAWLLDRQDSAGRWRNQSTLRGRTWVDVDTQSRPSKWVTLRACAVLKAAYG